MNGLSDRDRTGSVVADVLRSACAGVPLGCVTEVLHVARLVVYGRPAPQGSK